jgi:lysophospholipase L1-like esterase
MEHAGTYNPFATMAATPEKTRADMAEAIFKAGWLFGMEVIDMSLCGINEESGDSGVLTSDNVHPNAQGTKQLVAFLSRQLELRYVKYVQ